MAAAMDAYSAEAVGELLRCPVCLDRYTQPCILPCQHTFCKSPCLEGLVDMRSRVVRCPECRMEHFVPYGGADGFPINRTIANFLDLQPNTARAAEVGSSDQAEVPDAGVGTATLCGVCEKEGPTSKCIHCEKLACDACRKSHFTQMKFDVGRLVNQLRRGIPKLSTSISDIEHKSEQVTQQVEAVKSEVRDTTERYIKELKDREKLLMSELDTFLVGEQRGVRLLQENLEIELATISSYCDSTEARLNQKEVELEEGELLAFREQCSEYMSQIRNVEGGAQTRTIRFSFDGQQLQSIIASFGELLVNNPSTIPSDSSSQPTGAGDVEMSQVNSPPSPAVPPPTPPRRTLGRPIHTVYEEAALSPRYRPTISPHFMSPRGSVSPPPPRHATHDSNIYRRSSDILDLRPSHSFDNLNPYQRLPSVPRATVSESPRNSNYMFQMDTDTTTILSQLDHRRRMEQQRARPHRNASSIFGPSWEDDANDDSPPLGQEIPRTPDERTLERERELQRQRDLTARYNGPRAVDPRPAIAFSVSLSGEVAMEESRPVARPPLQANRRGRGRGTRRPPATPATASPTGDAETPVNAHHEPVPGSRGRGRGTRSNTRGRGSNRGQGSRKRDRATANNDSGASASNVNVNNSTAQSSREPQPGPSASAATEEPLPSTSSSLPVPNNDPGTSVPAPLQRRGTFVMDEPPADLQRPHVASRRNSASGPSSNANNNAATTDSPTGPPRRTSESVNVEKSLFQYKKKGKLQLQIGRGKGSVEGKFSLPRGVSMSPNNDSVVVADSNNHRVQVFDCNGRLVNCFGKYGTGPGEFDCLSGVAVGPDGQIVVADRFNHRIQVFDRYGQFERQFGELGSNPGEFSCPWGVAVSADGNICVCDKENHRIQIFQADGTFIRLLGGHGQGPGQFINPHYVAVGPDGTIAVADTENHRIQLFSPSGQNTMTFGSEGEDVGRLRYPKGIAIDRQGFVLVVDSGNYRVQVFRGDGRHYAMFGKHGTGRGMFKGGEGLAVGSQGQIAVCDKDAHRVQLF